MSNTEKTGRKALKTYFEARQVPTQGQFAQLIDAGFNQADDGIAKDAKSPLKIQAATEPAGKSEVLRFYESFVVDPKPKWTLALKADSKPGLNVSDHTETSRLFIADGGNVGIGTTVPTSTLSVKGNVAVGETYAGKEAPANGLIVEGNVGIGTTAPKAKLDVLGAVKLGTDVAESWFPFTDGSAIVSGKEIIFRTHDNAESRYHKRMIIGESGTVTIGPTLPHPDSMLRIESDDVQNPGEAATLHLGPLSGGVANLSLGYAREYTWIQSSGRKPLALNPLGSHVGIGTADPKSPLSISGKGAQAWIAADLGNGTEGDRVVIGTYVNTTKAAIGAHNQALSAWADLLINPAGGKVGIGKTDPKAALDVNGDVIAANISLNAWISDNKYGNDYVGFSHKERGEQTNYGLLVHKEGDTYLNAGAGKNIYFRVENNDKMVIDKEGNVGIGTTTPKAKLDVNGDIYAGNSDIYFTKTDHAHTMKANVQGHAAIENASDYNTLMILGRARSVNPLKRHVSVYDDLHVDGSISTGGYVMFRTHPNGSHARIQGKLLAMKDYNGFWLGDIQNRKKEEDSYLQLVMVCSRDLKENIAGLSGEEATATLSALNPVKYDYKKAYAFRPNLGFIAEEMPDILASHDRKSISPFEVIPVLTKVAQEQQRTITALQERLRRLEEQTP